MIAKSAFDSGDFLAMSHFHVGLHVIFLHHFRTNVTNYGIDSISLIAMKTVKMSSQ